MLGDCFAAWRIAKLDSAVLNDRSITLRIPAEDLQMLRPAIRPSNGRSWTTNVTHAEGTNAFTGYARDSRFA